MELVILSLVAGIAIGYLRPPKAGGLKMIQWMTLAGLFILLAAMGAQLGSDDKVLANLDRIGLKALLLASMSVLGSILLVYVVFRWLEPGKSSRYKEGGRE